ncbi:MAG: DNA-processing protein DprA [Mariprofundaceae bacterium]|nr:DNA-processing protein DprA [Mariprofundaceae bacterium]
MTDQRRFIRVSQWDEPIACLGNPDILRKDKLALFCSRKCPGDLILKACDLARSLRDAGTTVISGFHTPVEKECLRILLRGTQPLIICPARSIEGMRVPAAWRKPLERGRLLILSPFGDGQRRMTAKLAEQRNEFVAFLADEVLFIHAAEGSGTRELADRCKAEGEGKMVRFLY